MDLDEDDVIVHVLANNTDPSDTTKDTHTNSKRVRLSGGRSATTLWQRFSTDDPEPQKLSYPI
jgi:hypothetical protein